MTMQSVGLHSDSKDLPKRQLNLDLWFPTPIYWIDVTDAQTLNKDLQGHILDWQSKDPGISVTNQGGWHSTTDMHTKEWADPLLLELQAMQVKVIENEQWTQPTKIGNMWANVNKTDASNKKHCHANASWSGVYYVKVPTEVNKNCGFLLLNDPRVRAAMIRPDHKPVADIDPRLWHQANYMPKEGRLLMYPAWLEHFVGVNETQEPRISVSFYFVYV